GRPRLWIDRVFTIGGFGTVVTGTLVDGHLEVGQEVEILPRGLRARIRGLQTHKTKIGRAVPGSRVAINLTGVSKQDLDRGDLVTVPGWLRPTTLADVRLDVLPDAPFPLKHNAQVKFFCGSAETVARLRLLGAEALSPGESGWVQLELEDPIPLVRGDRFIIRVPSPAVTVGGGDVVDPHPGRKHRRFRPEVLARLETLARGTPAEVLLQALERGGPQTVRDLLESSGLGEGAQSALAELLDAGDAVILDSIPEPAPARLVAARAWWSATTARMQEELAAYHARYPLRPGMGREGLRSALRLDPRAFNGLMARAAAEGLVADEAATVRLPGHEVRFSPQQQQAVDDLLAQFRAAPYATPSVKEAAARVGEEVLGVLLARGDLVQVSPEVLFLRETYQEMVERIRAHIRQHGSITLAQVRDLFQTSRKYAQALLEYLDGVGITRRVGDERVLAEK
ncbi:MAG: SelB C-terminal domain-containing protein, partial [Anaerolineae bacterium]|nr:SelB C-terminal domain-containing protein [Anaerolineae bacterium]